MKSFLLLNIKWVNATSIIAYTTLSISNKINITNEYMLFDDGFIRREHATNNEPEFITVYDCCGYCLGNYKLTSQPDLGKPCVWSIDNNSDKELLIRRLKAITEPSTAKDYYKWLESQDKLPQDKLAYLKGEAYKEGLGVIKNFLKASKEFKNGADAGNSACKVAYAELLLNGWFGQQPDVKNAILFLESAITEGNLLAKSRLAEVYIKYKNLPGAFDKVLQIGLGLINSTEGIASDSLIRIMAEYYNNPTNVEYDTDKAIELYSRFDPNVTLKEFAFLLIDNKNAGKDETRTQLEEKAFAFVSDASKPVFNDENGSEEMRKALLCKCHRVGIGTLRNIEKCLSGFYYISISQSRINPNYTPSKRTAVIRERYENLLAAIDRVSFSIMSNPSTDISYRKYGALLNFLGYLKEFTNEDMPNLSDEINKLSSFINSLGNEYVNGYKNVLIEQQKIEERAAQARVLWEQQEQMRKLKEAAVQEEERQRKLKEEEERREQWKREAEERLQSGKDVLVRFLYKYSPQFEDEDDFDDNPLTCKSEFRDRISKEEYLALITGGDKAIKAYVQAHEDEYQWGDLRRIIISATMTKES